MKTCIRCKKSKTKEEFRTLRFRYGDEIKEEYTKTCEDCCDKIHAKYRCGECNNCKIYKNVILNGDYNVQL